MVVKFEVVENKTGLTARNVQVVTGDTA
jgi:hypothetical protein